VRELRRVLEVAVHDDRRVSRGAVESGGDRDLVPEVACEADDLEARIAAVKVVEKLRAAVGASVVYEDDLCLAVELVEYAS